MGFARGDGKPNRFYNIYTPKNYVASEGNTKVIFGFHGYSDSGIAPTIAAPVCGYDFKTNKASVPAISFVGTKDPTHPVYQKKPKNKCVQSSKYEGGHRFVSSHQITTVWAKGEPGCDVTDENEFPTRNFEFKGLTKLTCRTWCKGDAPFSLDCFYKAKHDDMPNDDPFAYEAAMIFFDSHLDASLDRKRLG